MRDILMDMTNALDNKGRNKMTTVKQLIEWLQTIPENSTVEVEYQDPDGYSVMTGLEIENCSVVRHSYLKDRLVVQLGGGE